MLNITALKVVYKNFEYIVDARKGGKSWKDIQMELKNTAGLACSLEDLSIYYKMVSWERELDNRCEQ